MLVVYPISSVNPMLLPILLNVQYILVGNLGSS